MGNIFNVARPSPDKIVMATKFVNEAIAKNKVVIFSKTYCPYCTMAKEQFKKLQYDFETIELDKRESLPFDSSEIQHALGEITGATTVPRVFVNGKFIGGGTDVKKLNESGQLKKLLE